MRSVTWWGRALLAATMAVGVSGVGYADAAPAVPAALVCGPQWRMDTVVAGQGQLENLAPDGRGGMYLSELRGVVFHLDAQGRKRMVAPDLGATGLELSGTTLYVLGGSGTLSRIDTTTGKRTHMVSGLAGPNGVVLLPDGDFLMTRPGLGDEGGPATGITRFSPATGKITTGWSPLEFTDGLALSDDRRAVYTTNIITGQIMRIPLDDPKHPTAVARIPGIAPGPDDLAVSKQGMLFVTGHVDGKIYEVDPRTGTVCVIASGLGGGWIGPTSARIGPDGHAWSLFVTVFDGTVRRLRPPPGHDVLPTTARL